MFRGSIVPRTAARRWRVGGSGGSAAERPLKIRRMCCSPADSRRFISRLRVASHFPPLSVIKARCFEWHGLRLAWRGVILGSPNRRKSEVMRVSQSASHF